jgi:hypothetical protein
VAGPLGPSVVDDSVDERVDDCTILATVASVSSERGGSGISDERSGNNARLSASQAREHLEDGLELGVIEGIWGAVCVDTKCIDGRLVAGVESSGRVGRVSNERVDGVGHLVAELKEVSEVSSSAMHLDLSLPQGICPWPSWRDSVRSWTRVRSDERP